MDFVSLPTVLAGIAESVELHPHLDDQATRIGKISRAAADAFWQEHNPKIEKARKIGWAAMLLNKALHYSDSPPQWMEFDEQKKFAVRTDAVGAEGVELLTDATGWGNRVQRNCSDHFRAAITEGDAALSMPVQHGNNDGIAPRALTFRGCQIGFDRGELVEFLAIHQITHGLGIADKAPDKASATRKESKEDRQARRYQMCIAAGLTMPTDDYAHLPRGIGELAKREEITRQAFAEDVKAHIVRTSGR